MKQELAAYLFRSNGQVLELPTDELLDCLEQIKLADITQVLDASADNRAIWAFLQRLKWTMRTGRTVSRETSVKRAGTFRVGGEPDMMPDHRSRF